MLLLAGARKLNKRKHSSKSAYRRLLNRVYRHLTGSISNVLNFSRLTLEQVVGHVRDFIVIIDRPVLPTDRLTSSHSFLELSGLINQALVAAMTVAAPSNPANDAKETTAFTEAFKERLHEVRRIIEEDRYRKRVLLLCQQTEPRSFEEYSSSGSFRKLEKFESSTYSEVLKAIDLADNNKPVVMKIMRALSRGVIKKLPPVTARGCQSYNDILNELEVTQALSKLHECVTLNGKQNAVYKTTFFCLIHEIKVVSGNLERTLSKSQAAASKLAINSVNTHSNKENSNNLMRGGGHSEKQLVAGKKLTIAPISLSQTMKTTTNESTKHGEASSSSSHQQVSNKIEIQDEELKDLSEEDRMLMEALPYEYVVSVMRHDGSPLWWMMTHKKLSPEQLASVLVQTIVGLAIAEKVYSYEHRDLHVSNILIKKTAQADIPFTLNGNKYNIVSYGTKATIIDATFSRMTQNGKVYYRDLTSTLKAYGSKKTPTKMSLQNSSYRKMVHLTNNKWQEFTPKTNVVWLTYLCETLIKNDVMKSNPKLQAEIKKIRDHTLKVNTTLELLGFFPFETEKKEKKHPAKTTPISKISSKSTISRVRTDKSSTMSSRKDVKSSTMSSHKNGK